MRKWHAIIKDCHSSDEPSNYEALLPNRASHSDARVYFCHLFFLDDWAAYNASSVVFRDGDPVPEWDESTNSFYRKRRRLSAKEIRLGGVEHHGPHVKITYHDGCYHVSRHPAHRAGPAAVSSSSLWGARVHARLLERELGV